MMTEAAKKHYEPLPWTNFFDELTYTDDVTANLLKGTSIFRAGENGVAFFCIHGAGHSAMSFALLAKEVKHFGTLLAFDFKGHGASKNLQNV
jgi:protein phosphatase methylesterase 1